jgi:hypothetical protein
VHLPGQLTCLWKEPAVAKKYRSAISLHGHTHHSKEALSFIGEYLSRHPLVRTVLESQTNRAQTESSITVDYTKAYWTPPLPPLQAFLLERDQIERVLGLTAMVSLTDHDNIEAPKLLRVLPETSNIPLSVEWTVPYRNSIFHIGVHNLPAERVKSMMAKFADYTANPADAQLVDLLKMLHDTPDALVVLNHPMWDLVGAGKQRHISVLNELMVKAGMFIHALELGGLRRWEENQAVVEFAEGWDQLVIGGGDRHGTEPNAILNLSNTDNFSGFVHEVRQKRRSHVLFMPQYSQPVTLRILLSLVDAIREYPDQPEGSREWDQRAFHPDRHGVVRPLANLWVKRPAFVCAFFSAVRLLEVPFIRWAAQTVLAEPNREMQFVPGRGREVVSQWSKAYGSRFFQTRTTKSTAWRTPAGNSRRSPSGADSPY